MGRDTLLSIALEAGETLDEIVVKGEQAKRFNVSVLSKQDLLSVPSLGGKPDVMKALQLVPGIQAQQEGSSLINVRGGNPGENLYLIDNTPLIYVNHLGGFMSVFNPERSITLVFKGYFRRNMEKFIGCGNNTKRRKQVGLSRLAGHWPYRCFVQCRRPSV